MTDHERPSESELDLVPPFEPDYNLITYRQKGQPDAGSRGTADAPLDPPFQPDYNLITYRQKAQPYPEERLKLSEKLRSPAPGRFKRLLLKLGITR